jgi:preprotein translocase subunit SecE
VESLKRFPIFLKESWHEVRHQVTYPSKEEVKGTAIVVIITSAIFAVLLFGIDMAMGQAVSWVFERFA